MLLAPQPIAEQIRTLAREFFASISERDYDRVWNFMITLDAIELVSMTTLPLHFQTRGGIDKLIAHPKSIEGISLAFQQDLTFPGDDKGIRTRFFDGLVEGFDKLGWNEPFRDETSLVFLKGSAAVLVADSAISRKSWFLPFVEEGTRGYRIDMEAITAFSMALSAQRLHRLATRVLEIGDQRLALTIYDMAARLGGAYTRLRQLVWEHPMVETIITKERKEELQSEYAYTVLADEQARVLLADPKLAQPVVDVGRFLQRAFKHYDRVADVDVDDEDIQRLVAMDDSDLRVAIADVLLGVDRVEAKREARKPHTPAEIADMEVLVAEGTEFYHLLMPVKSGREIREQSVPVEVFYQILRPHMFLSRGVVVFITAKPCSQFLHNLIKTSRDRFGWPIGVIEGRDLAALLKLNDLI